MLDSIQCLHAKPSGRAGSVRCTLGLYGGRPYISLCDDCSQRITPINPPNGDESLPQNPQTAQGEDVAVLEDSLARNCPTDSAEHKQKFAPRGDLADKDDDQPARWGREQHEGFLPGREVQSTPLLFTADHHPVWLRNFYRGRSAFLICGGPSFADLNHAFLRQPGVLTMAVNNAAKTFRPNLWVSVDSPDHFLRSIWLDPTITKFAPLCHATKRIFDSDGWKWMQTTVRDCPSIIYYDRNEHFQPEQFLWEDTFNWGNHKRHGGGRSVMLPAIRLLFYLGIRRVFLLGADFNMDRQSKYHFPQERARGSINGNNWTYQKLNKWFKELRPLFERENFEVLNCNPKSRLEAFKSVSFEDAVEQVMREWGHIDVGNERTAGLYDTNKGIP
jgi:hypothetical protein